MQTKLITPFVAYSFLVGSIFVSSALAHESGMQASASKEAGETQSAPSDSKSMERTIAGSPEFPRMSRELQTLSKDVGTLLTKFQRDKGFLEKFEALAKAGNFREAEAMISASVPERYEVHVLEGDTGVGRIKIRICIIFNPEINISVEW